MYCAPFRDLPSCRLRASQSRALVLLLAVTPAWSLSLHSTSFPFTFDHYSRSTCISSRRRSHTSKLVMALRMLYAQILTIRHPWSHVIIGMWHKYPNPHCTHVVTVDTLSRTVDPGSGVIRTERLLGCKQKAPAWIVKVGLYVPTRLCDSLSQIKQLFGGSEDAFVRETSFVDPATRIATITSVNLSMSQFATCYERIRYSPTAAGDRTTFVQTAEVQARMALWRSAADKLEKWLVQRFEQNANLGKVGFSDVLRTLRDERRLAQPVA